jgi:hypothetical protein
MENFIKIDLLGSSDYESYMLVHRAYRDYAFGEEVWESGFNDKSGYVYIALENGVQIASSFGNEVEYIVYNYTNEEEFFFDNYNNALKYLQDAN